MYLRTRKLWLTWIWYGYDDVEYDDDESDDDGDDDDYDEDGDDDIIIMVMGMMMIVPSVEREMGHHLQAAPFITHAIRKGSDVIDSAYVAKTVVGFCHCRDWPEKWLRIYHMQLYIHQCHQSSIYVNDFDGPM